MGLLFDRGVKSQMLFGFEFAIGVMLAIVAVTFVLYLVIGLVVWANRPRPKYPAVTVCTWSHPCAECRAKGYGKHNATEVSADHTHQSHSH